PPVPATWASGRAVSAPGLPSQACACSALPTVFWQAEKYAERMALPQGEAGAPRRRDNGGRRRRSRSPADAGCPDAGRCRARVAEAGEAKHTCRGLRSVFLPDLTRFPCRPGHPVVRVRTAAWLGVIEFPVMLAL